MSHPPGRPPSHVYVVLVGEWRPGAGLHRVQVAEVAVAANDQHVHYIHRNASSWEIADDEGEVDRFDYDCFSSCRDLLERRRVHPAAPAINRRIQCLSNREIKK